MSSFTSALSSALADFSDACSAHLEHASEASIGPIFELSEKIAAYVAEVSDSSVGKKVVKELDDTLGEFGGADAELQHAVRALALLVIAMPEHTKAQRQLKSNGFKLLHTLHDGLADLLGDSADEASEEEVFAMFEPVSESLARRTVPSFHASQAPTFVHTVAIMDADFPTDEDSPRSLFMFPTYRTPEMAAAHLGDLLRTAGWGGKPQFFTCHADLESSTNPKSADEMHRLLLQLRPDRAVQCWFKRQESGGARFMSIVDHTHPSGVPTSTPIFRANDTWDHSGLLRRMIECGAGHIDLTKLYRFYTTENKARGLSRMNDEPDMRNSFMAENELHLFDEPMSSHQLGIVFVKTLTGKTIPVELGSVDSTVYALKRAVQEVDGIPPSEQRLIFRGFQLVDGQSLSELGVETESTVHLVLRLCGD